MRKATSTGSTSLPTLRTNCLLQRPLESIDAFISTVRLSQLCSQDQSEASEVVRFRVGDEVLSESPPGEEVYQYDEMELSSPLPDRPSSSREESPPLSEPGSMSSSGSNLNTDSKFLK